MKKVLFLGLLTAMGFSSYAQNTDSLKTAIQKNAEAIGHGGNNELKINLLFSILAMPEITYERILADNMSVGASVLIGADNSDNFNYNFAFTPYYRLYFGQKKASGFFIEGNASVANIRDDYYHFDPAISYAPGYGGSVRRENHTNFGLGASVGGKFLTRNGFLGEAYMGVGRFMGSNSSAEAYPRMGITIGKRF
ncbi:MAG: hypothetical protein EOO90_09535 [Pedobacter sp.]|nr:MAG: hypothetical protein EOO90_09535 [Pedobacter sp.]